MTQRMTWAALAKKYNCTTTKPFTRERIFYLMSLR